jgi:ribosomal protein L11 methyltransferase
MWHILFELNKVPALAMQPILHELFDTVVYHQDDEEVVNYTIELIFEDKPDKDGVYDTLASLDQDAMREVALTLEKLPEHDWLQHVYDQLQPIDAGTFFVYGSHYTDAIPANKIPLLIEAATGFGTGEHPTTKGCLILCDQLHKDGHAFRNIFDLGCGSGILAIGAAKLWDDARILGVDIDEQSIDVAQHHKDTNGVGEAVLFYTGDGLDDPLVGERAPFDLLFANILAQPLIDFADGIVAATQTDGYIILSGFLDEQAERVLAPYLAQSCTLIATQQIDQWQAVLLKKTA